MDPIKAAEYYATIFSNLRKIVREREEFEGRGFTQAYAVIRSVNEDGACVESSRDENIVKNRYRNVLAYDATRVVLQDMPDGNDYINANWIPGYGDRGQESKRAYIATQGPVPESMSDFWHMIFQEKVSVLVMTTKEVEGGNLKCHRYWPDPTSSPPKKVLLFGDVKVQFVSAESHRDALVRTFNVIRGDETHLVTQICYLSWPDHGVPLTTGEFLRFRDFVSSVQRASQFPSSPIAIHCSAGVGRTGTYIAIDMMIKSILLGLQRMRPAYSGVDQVCATLRQSRNHMVQTEAQYLFIFKALLDWTRTMLARATQQTQSVVSSLVTEAKREQEELDEEIKAEEEEIGKILGPQAETDAAPSSADEIGRATDEWSKEKRGEYDVLKSLTSVQSRVESLKSKGVGVDKATLDQLQTIVSRSKAHIIAVRAQEEREAQQMAEAKAAQEAKKLADAEQAKKDLQKREKELKAAHFMRKLSGTS